MVGKLITVQLTFFMGATAGSVAFITAHCEWAGSMIYDILENMLFVTLFYPYGFLNPFPSVLPDSLEEILAHETAVICHQSLVQLAPTVSGLRALVLIWHNNIISLVLTSHKCS